MGTKIFYVTKIRTGKSACILIMTHIYCHKMPFYMYQTVVKKHSTFHSLKKGVPVPE